MSDTYEDAVFEFDLNYLNQSTTNNDFVGLKAKYDRLRNSFVRVKSRVVKTDALIKAYYEKKLQLEGSLKNIAIAKEESKKLCVELNNTIDALTKLENEKKSLQNANNKLEEICNQYKNSYDAQVSLVRQLQSLLKKKDALIESSKNENKDTSSTKNSEKKALSLARERLLLKKLNILAGLMKKSIGNKKLKPKYEAILRKYDTSNDEDHSDCSDGASDIFEDVLLSPSSDMVNQQDKKSLIASPDMSPDSVIDYSNEIVSIDTGRGSSLAFSEKCLLSPDYYSNDSPLTGESVENKTRAKVSIATSPIRFEERVDTVTCASPAEKVDTATSPIPVQIEVQSNMCDLENEFRHSDCSPEFLTFTEKDTVDTDTPVSTCSTKKKKHSKITETEDTITPVPTCSTKKKRHSNITEIESEIVISLDENLDDSAPFEYTSPSQEDECLDSQVFKNNSPKNYPQHAQEKQCLELNNSNYLQQEKETDCEIQNIINKTQLNFRILSPIPRTPALETCAQSSNLADSSSEHTENARTFKPSYEASTENSVMNRFKRDISAIQNVAKQKLLVNSQIMILTEAYSHLVNTDDCSKSNCFENIVSNVGKLLNSMTYSNFNMIRSSPDLMQAENVSMPLNQYSPPRHSEYLQKNLDLRNSRTSLPRLRDEHITQNSEYLQKSPDLRNCRKSLPRLRDEQINQNGEYLQNSSDISNCRTSFPRLPDEQIYQNSEYVQKSSDISNCQTSLSRLQDEHITQNNEYLQKSPDLRNCRTSLPRLRDEQINQTSEYLQKSSDISNCRKSMLRLPDEQITQNSEYLQKSPVVSNCHISLPRLQDEQIKKLLSQSHVSEDIMKDCEISVNIDSSNDNIEINQSRTKVRSSEKSKTKNVSKLQKFKSQLQPKYKIRSATPPFTKMRNKKKQITTLALKQMNLIEKSNSSALLNDENVYAKAVKIMADLNSKQGLKSTKSRTDLLPSNSSEKCEKKESSIEMKSKHNGSTDNRIKTPPREKRNSEGKQGKLSIDNSPNLIEVMPLKIMVESKSHTALNGTRTSPRAKGKKSLESLPKPDVEVSLSNATAESVEHRDKTLNYNETSRRKLSFKEGSETVKSLRKSIKDFELQHQNNSTINFDESSSRIRLNLKRGRKSLDCLSKPDIKVPLLRSRAKSVEYHVKTLNCNKISKRKLSSKEGSQTVKFSPITLKKLFLSSNDIIELNNHNDNTVNSIKTSPRTRLNSKQGNKTPESLPKPVREVLSLKLGDDVNDSTIRKHTSPNTPITTRNKRKNVDNSPELLRTDTSLTESKNSKKETSIEKIPMKRYRQCSNEPEIPCTRILRSSKAHLRLSTEDNTEQSNAYSDNKEKFVESPNVHKIKINDALGYVLPDLPNHKGNLQLKQLDQHYNVISYDDLDMFSEEIQCDYSEEKLMSCPLKQDITSNCDPKDSILSSMIQKYVKGNVKLFPKKQPVSLTNKVFEMFEQGIETIIKLPYYLEKENAKNKLVEDLKKLQYRHFLSGFMKYIIQPERKIELCSKISRPPAPPMTQAEEVLLYVITQLQNHWPAVDIVDAVLKNIEYLLFTLNRTPDFNVIDSTSHFYAIICQSIGAKSRLRIFMLDAMYCIQFKSVALIKHCLDVWNQVIPLAHMEIANTPLVKCLIYLLHFYQCKNDKFNRVQEIRTILNRKYFYRITDWTESNILEMLRNSILELNNTQYTKGEDISLKRKTLRLALIITAKRHGPWWCQNNIITKLLVPFVTNKELPSSLREFCISMIGPLTKPYPNDMKMYNQEAMNKLIELLKKDPLPQIEHAVIMSCTYMAKYNYYRVNQLLLTRKMRPMSPVDERVLRDYVTTVPLKTWMAQLSKIVNK